MAGGFLQLAYIAEVSIVFNLAYSELRDRRYVVCAENTITALRNKLGEKGTSISREHSALYANLDGLTSAVAKLRRPAWACCDKDGVLLGTYSAILSEVIYPFFTHRRDKKFAENCIVISVLVVVFLTLCDHYTAEIPEESVAKLWWGSFTALFLCMTWPAVTIFLGRQMMARLNKVSTHLHDEFTKIIEPSLKEAIAKEIQALTDADHRH